jgi:F-type H+-transporting ATPase subunit gamma
MPSLKDLRNRITSVKATQKITKAMQMVAAAKLRRAQSAAESARPYAERMEEVMANLAGSMVSGTKGPTLLSGTGQDQTHLLVVCTAERGLCGAFNSSIARLAREKAISLMNEGKTVKILCVGKKGYDVLRRQFEGQILEMIDLRSVRSLGFEHADPIGKKIIALFDAGAFDVCTLFFSRFKSVIAQIPTALQMIPATIPVASTNIADTEYEPDQEQILASLLPRNISVQVFRALLENAASEQGARMSAMDNRSRQAMITKELIEIISGAEAL